MTVSTSSDYKKTLALFQQLAADVLEPPPELTVSEWADQYRRLSSEGSAEPGQWRTDRAPYQRGIMDSINDPDCEKVVIMSSAQVGKALDINTKLPTPNGWTTMGDIKVGDKLFDEKGEVCEVQYVTDLMHNHTCYEVVFSDGSKIIADADHQWTVDVYKYGNKYERKTLKTSDMLLDYKQGVRNKYGIPVAQSLQLSKKKLPIPPYVLGVWLGDGNSYSAQITVHKKDKETLEYIQELGCQTEIINPNNSTWTVKIDPYKRNNICIRGHDTDTLGLTKNGYCAECSRQYAMKHKYKDESRLDPIIHTVSTMHNKLEQLNLLKNKHIPTQYLRSSKEQRLALLQGMMDSDGHITKRGRCEYSTVSKSLADGFQDLLSGLGIKHTRKKKVTVCTYKGKKYTENVNGSHF